MTAIGTAIVIHGFQFPAFTFAAAGVACVFAAAPARAAGLLASSAVVAATRTEDVSEMGDAWRRMRATAGVLLAAAFALGLSAVGALAIGVDSRSRFGLVLGEAVFLVSVGALRVFMAVGTGPLQRRRAFDPDRVRDVPSAARAWPYWLAAASLALAAASLVPALLKFLDGATHQPAKPAAYALWLAVALAGLAVAAFSHARSRQGALRASRWLGDATMSRLAAATVAFNRFVLTPLARLVDRTGEWLPAGDGALGRATLLTGRIAVSAARAPAVPELLVMALLLALLIGLLSPGVLR
jgi:NADH:ubiquinone oxidoreductase subunit 5 (subunit L)/multisubunit Na+/H+ antiporter MnhA subunit